MSHVSAQNAGRFTTFFASVAAGDVTVSGLPAGAAGSCGSPARGFSTMAGSFAIGPDTAALLRAALSFTPNRNYRIAPAMLAAE